VFDDLAIISFLLPTSKSRVSAYIYDLEANLIQQIAADLPAGPTLPNLQWAGKSSTGKTLPAGRYIILIKSLNYQTGSILSGKKVIILAGR
jgi:flagellar hook assembly protein FlgD